MINDIINKFNECQRQKKYLHFNMTDRRNIIMLIVIYHIWLTECEVS